MSGPGCRLARLAAIGAVLICALQAGCGTVDRVRGKEGAANDAEAVKVKPEDPLARPIQVAWTSARAKHCGFLFDPARLRANYLASEAAAGAAQLQKIEHAYDYTYQSVLDGIKDDPSYCSKAKADAIRAALNRYLAGDYAPAARAAR